MDNQPLLSQRRDVMEPVLESMSHVTNLDAEAGRGDEGGRGKPPPVLDMSLKRSACLLKRI